MADVRTCANCGNTQTSGDFCEKCGTRMPAAAAPVAATSAAAGAAAAYTAARPATPPPAASSSYTGQGPYGAAPQYAPPPQYGAQPGYQAPPYGYAEPRDGWGKLFDFSFQGFITAGTLKTLYIINLGLIGAYLVFNIILAAISPFEGGYVAMYFLISLFVTGFWFFLSRIIFELMATALRIREKVEK